MLQGIKSSLLVIFNEDITEILISSILNETASINYFLKEQSEVITHPWGAGIQLQLGKN